MHNSKINREGYWRTEGDRELGYVGRGLNFIAVGLLIID